MDAMMVVGISGFALLSAVTAVLISVAKHRRPWLWGTLALVFNLPGLMVITVMPPYSERRSALALQAAPPAAVPAARPIAV